MTGIPARMIWALGITQIIGYGTLYYSFAILAEDGARDFRLPVSTVFAVFSLALLVGGLVAPFAGRRMDRHGAAAVMAAGSAGAAATLAAMALAPGPLSLAALLVASQVAATLIQYDAAFTCLVQSYGPAARIRITHLTLIAGFSSTLFWPLASWLHAVMDWRTVLLVFAAMNLLVCLPLHVLAAVAGPARADLSSAPAAADGAPTTRIDPPLPAPVARRVFALMAGGFALSGFLLSALLAQMVPTLAALGLGASALAVSTLFGPAQVLVRFANMLVGVRAHPLAVTLLGMAMLPLAALILAGSAPMAAGAAAFAVLLGFGSGLKSIVQGTLPLALFGGAAYGARLGRMALVRQFLAAAAPFLFAWHVEASGPTVALVAAAAVGIAGLAAFVEIARVRRSLGAASPLPG